MGKCLSVQGTRTRQNPGSVRLTLPGRPEKRSALVVGWAWPIPSRRALRPVAEGHRDREQDAVLSEFS